MKKITLLTTALFMAFGNTISAKAFRTEAFDTLELEANRVAVLEKKASNIYNVAYDFEEDAPVKVRLVDSNNRTVHSRTSFKKTAVLPYDFSFLPEGEYRFELTSKGKTVLKHVYYYKIKPVVKVDSIEPGKFKVTVKGAFTNPVSIYITDEASNLVFEDTVKDLINFDRVYDLSSLNNRKFNFNVLYNETNFRTSVEK